MVLIRIRREGRQDGRGNAGLVSREQPLKAEVVQRLIGVVSQETLYILGPAELVVEILGVINLVVVELVEKIEGVFLNFFLLLSLQLVVAILELVANVVTVHCLVTDDKADDVSGVGQLRTGREIHR